MSKRAIAAFLWFATVWFGYEILWSLVDVPRVIGPFIAALVAIVVTIDPAARFWSATTETRAAPQARSSQPTI